MHACTEISKKTLMLWTSSISAAEGQTCLQQQRGHFPKPKDVGCCGGDNSIRYQVWICWIDYSQKQCWSVFELVVQWVIISLFNSCSHQPIDQLRYCDSCRSWSYIYLGHILVQWDQGRQNTKRQTTICMHRQLKCHILELQSCT